MLVFRSCCSRCWCGVHPFVCTSSSSSLSSPPLGCVFRPLRTPVGVSVVGSGCVAAGLARVVGLDKVGGGCAPVCACSCCCRAGVGSSGVGCGLVDAGTGWMGLLCDVLSWL